jgi:hypothetical protein
MGKRFLSIAVLFLAVVLSAAAAPKRYALVIGNSDYAKIERLRTPANDAADIAAALERLGYQVDLKLDVGIAEMEEAIIRYSDRLSLDRSNEGFFWYAGHGVQIEGENYLLPVDMQAERISQVRRSAYSLTELLRSLELARNMVNVVVLDACRNNPLPAEGRSLNRGLSAAPVIQDTFIMFSTAAGAVASDGDSSRRNSPFTEAFLNNIGKALPIETVAKDIAVETIRITQVNQRPYISDNILFVRGYSLNVTGADVVTINLNLEVTVNPPVQPRPQPEMGTFTPQNAAEFTLDNTRAWNIGVLGTGLMDSGGEIGGGGTTRYTFFESFKPYGSLFFLPNSFFVEGNYSYVYNYDEGMKAHAGRISLGFMYRIRIGASQRFLFGMGFSAGPQYAAYTWAKGFERDDRGDMKPVGAFGIFLFPGADLSFRFNPRVSLGLGLGYGVDVFSVAQTKYGIGAIQAALGLSYRNQR